MNKVLLLYPSFLNMEEKIKKTLYTDLPLSIITLSAQLVNQGYEVEVMDQCLEDFEYRSLEKKLNGCFLVGISAITSYQIINGLKFAGMIKQYNKSIKIVWGGWHASLMPEQTIHHENVDIVIKGPGEEQIVDVADCIKNRRSLNYVPNIYFKTPDGEIKKTQEKIYDTFQLKNNITDGYKTVDVERYVHAQWGNQRVLGYESSRGCCCQCKFCSIGSLYHGKWYGLPAEDVCHDISYLKRCHKIDAVHFFDNNFFVNKNRALEIAKLFKENKLGIRWDGTIIVQQFLLYKPKEIEFLIESGLYRIIAGIESGDQDVLKKINKHHKNEQVIECVRRCKEYGLLPSFSFMVGFPWDPEEDTKRTLELASKLRSIHPETEILMFIFSPYLGTPLYETAVAYGMSFPDSLEGWAKFTYEKANTPWLSKKLCKKINRYLTFFGTINQSEKEKEFFNKFHQLL